VWGGAPALAGADEHAAGGADQVGPAAYGATRRGQRTTGEARQT